MGLADSINTSIYNGVSVTAPYALVPPVAVAETAEERGGDGAPFDSKRGGKKVKRSAASS